MQGDIANQSDPSEDAADNEAVAIVVSEVWKVLEDLPGPHVAAEVIAGLHLMLIETIGRGDTEVEVRGYMAEIGDAVLDIWRKRNRGKAAQ